MVARSLFVESKKLRVFDFDDTLIKTDSYIYITHSNGKKSKLTPGQFAVYNAKPGDSFDFNDFHAVKNPKIIKAYFEVLKRVTKDASGKGVFILTARAAYKPIYDFIKDSGIKDVYVVALGSNDPEHKADWIEKKIKDEKIDDVYFIDDSPKNVDAVRRRLEKYPNIKKRVQLAKHQ